MKKRNIILTFLSICGVVTVFAFVAANTVRNNNARQSVVSQKGFENPVYTADTPVGAVYNSEITDNSEKSKNSENSEKTDTPETVYNSEEPEVSASANDETEIAVNAETEPEKYVMPVAGGKIINDFTDSVLVFQETYGDYRTHLGIDIEAEENTPVVSVADGIVTKSYMDYEEGYVVEIEHDKGITGIYKNLSTNEMAPVGKVVSCGETIGAVGKSGIFEGHLPAHLHFEMLEDNAEINPIEKLEQ